MEFGRRKRRRTLALVLFTVACTGPEVTSPQPPQSEAGGRVSVVVRTTGQKLDSDGFVVKITGVTLAGQVEDTARVAAAPSSETTFTGLADGSYSILLPLQDVANNCQVVTPLPLQVTVDDDSRQLVIDCTCQENPAVAIQVVAGQAQTAQMRSSLAGALTVRALDAVGLPVVDAAVSWSVTGGGGSANPAVSRTDAAGRASSTWSLGSTAGVQTLAATLNESLGAVFSATALAGPPTTLLTTGDGQVAGAGAALAEPLAVQVVDAGGNLLEGVQTAWSVVTGGGHLSSANTQTDITGTASNNWTLGLGSGSQEVRVVVGALSAIFTATGSQGPPATIVIVSGDQQTAQTSTGLANPLVVEVRDASNNAATGVAVSWLVLSGGGSASPASTTTDSQGRTQTNWTLGALTGTQSAEGRVGSLSTPFIATAVAAPPASLSLVSGNQQLQRANGTLPTPLMVEVLDASGSPLSGLAVSWSPLSGGGSVIAPTSTTDAQGLAQTTWALGSSLGTQSAQASIGGLTVTFLATANTGLVGTVHFVSRRDSNGDWEVFRTPADGLGPRTQITFNQTWEDNPKLAPGGAHVAFDRFGGLGGIFRIDSSGANEIKISSSYGIGPSWSPSGNLIAYSNGCDILTAPPDGSQVETNLTNTACSRLFRDPNWSPSGAQLVLAADNPSHIIVMNSDGTAMTQLTFSSDPDFWPDWSPSGSKIVFARNVRGNLEVFVMNSDGTGLNNLSNHAASDRRPTWSLDGQYVVFESSRSGAGDLWFVKADGSEPPVRLTTSPAADGAPSITP